MIDRFFVMLTLNKSHLFHTLCLSLLLFFFTKVLLIKEFIMIRVCLALRSFDLGLSRLDIQERWLLELLSLTLRTFRWSLLKKDLLMLTTIRRVYLL